MAEIAASTGNGARGWLGFVLVLLALVVEGFDLQAANMAATSIVSSFGITRADIGPLLSASLAGVLIGAMFLAPLGDRFGRRAIIISCCAAYGVVSLIAAAATSITELIVLRFLIGIGIGAVLPNALALAGELAPPRLLASATGMIGIGITLGGTIAAPWRRSCSGWAMAGRKCSSPAGCSRWSLPACSGSACRKARHSRPERRMRRAGAAL